MKISILIIIVLSIAVITEILKKVLGKNKDTLKIVTQALSWNVGILGTLAAHFCGLDILEGMPLFKVMAHGLFTAFCANGVSNTKIIQTFMLLFTKKP